MKRTLNTLIIFLLISTSLLLSTTILYAAPTFTYPNYNVDIQINEDSTFIVKEEMEFEFYGDVHGMRRDIKKYDDSCFSQVTITCGGFDLIEILNVYDENDKVLDKDVYKLYDYEDEDSGDEFLRVEWELFPNGKLFNGEKLKWTVEYKVYGGIGWIQNKPYFYWNLLPESRGGRVDESEIKIRFPNSVNYKSQNFQIYDDFINTPNISFANNVLTLSQRSLPAFGDFTVSYEFGETEIQKPAELNYVINSPPFANSIYMNGILVNENSQDVIKGIPAGKSTFLFSHTGYKDKSLELNFEPGEEKEVVIVLEPEPWMSALLMLNNIMLIVGLCTVPLALIYVYLRYSTKGKDVNMPKTIIPLFSPPDETPPYLLGALKDEQVDKEDIVGSIIDLAYRGYIKIKEISEGSDYELTKLGGKEGDRGLNEMETEIIDALFGNSDSVKTSGLRSRFPTKYLLITNSIYSEMVKKGYFNKSPETVRGGYLSCGIMLSIFAIIASCFATIFGTGLTGYFVICSPLIGLFVLGIGLIIASKFMPAKTALGSKLYADILGFRMYLHTAERFRLQKLGPDEFEKYLSYAIVFKIEKEWAEKFKGIYDRVPDWYEGDVASLTDAYWVSNMTRSFSDAAVTSMTPISTSGSSGSGWGGSSGGFSGGGGGGGGGGSSGGF
jgi:hypothetical protein